MTVADTSFLIDVLRGRPDAVRMLEHLRGQGIQAPAATIQELYYGLAKTGFKTSSRRALEALLAGVPTAPLDRPIARSAGLLEARLEADGRKAGRIDLQIAATALASGEPLLTRDAGQLDIDGLDVQTY